ncbi:multiple sugar transport system ATP-binding protein [Clostridium acetobutylicum]|uniref:Multiple sugar-binding ABC-transporter, MSMX ATP-binding protein n=1 Tax=Clostridium acetobutylicum (strain ATCC 824 / DSM 792 / JCM 1419 / IAM 19013 / LMG 5710 / NBRC 13948 / NRRL B-527 / VKM B-1787 / 2291 / W) TaxID=272562 RepID=Q97E78_CLOAB|nr:MULTISPECIES: sn-glycerol-3-phosphate ABC transporter ATP-binding protein UgpC [Clostridium]AAK81172.1 Multiple sugar-binding ABC-transporter, MSMX ATP-binding protein [Clostridium acetobutylicum ATCC 824]ADZ22277.1 Multiple sugar-binding ABC-transporter, MSMX ATP-binding protein [Clostridium acetobutylicum EA 2018]AEI34240.1 sugar ABC transporter ATP-binding protein [Clostridium acetobutylicum DSM 1731]AWV81159.1 sn-glycerol-3-phosphate ABC transporter ATP-binding protein UgpC [Clostridium 
MADLSLKHIYKVYDGNVTAVKDFNLDVADKEFIVFVGPSGCGKSTTLRMIAGLEEITKGELTIGGRVVNDVSPKDRDIAMVFQNYALYPHMTVYENMAFGLKLRKTPKDVIDEKVKKAAEILDIAHLLDRKPKALSGGQRQRVAMGRAIVREPKVFLMDEPLSNLDAKLRVQMRTEIAKLHKDLQNTFIYVTHDQTEAMTLGTRIVVMKDGVIQQVDTPQNIYEKPKNMFVAGFIGSPQMNFVDSKVTEDSGKIMVSVEGQEIPVSGDISKILKENGYINKEVILGIRPENMDESPEFLQKHKDAIINAKVEVTELMGAETYIHLAKGKANFIVRVNGASTSKAGDEIKIGININKLHVFDKETEETIL